jgi:hypothetical protein
MPTPNINDFGVTFGGLDIVAIVLPFGTPAADLQVWRTQFAASTGISEIVGGQGGRVIEIPIVLRDASFTTRIKLEDFIDEINDKVGTNDTLKVFTQDDSILPYDNCTFHGFNMTSDPKPDEAGTLGAGTGRWFCQGVLRFYQLLF